MVWFCGYCLVNYCSRDMIMLDMLLVCFSIDELVCISICLVVIVDVFVV